MTAKEPHPYYRGVVVFDVATTVVVLYVFMITTMCIFIGYCFLCHTFSPSHFDTIQLTDSVLPHVYNDGCAEWGARVVLLNSQKYTNHIPYSAKFWQGKYW